MQEKKRPLFAGCMASICWWKPVETQNIGGAIGMVFANGVGSLITGRRTGDNRANITDSSHLWALYSVALLPRPCRIEHMIAVQIIFLVRDMQSPAYQLKESFLQHV